MKISEKWLDEQWQKYKEKYRENFSGFILVDYAYSDDVSEYYGYYFSPTSNIVLDNEGYFTPIQDYIEEDFFYTDMIYILMKDVELMDKKEIFNKNNWVLLWDKKNNNQKINENKNIDINVLNEIYDNINYIQKNLIKIKHDFDTFYCNMSSIINQIQLCLDTNDEM